MPIANNEELESRQKDLDRVIREVRYHKFTLPDGTETEGADRSATSNAIFDFDLAGKTVLDIGCKSGYFCVEAMLRGASRAVGIEHDRNTCRTLESIRRLYAYDGLEFIRGRFPKVKLQADRFDVVLLMNVVHHQPTLRGARKMIIGAAKLARERLVLCMRPPIVEEGPNAKKVGLIDWMIATDERVKASTGESKRVTETLLGRRYVEALLKPFAEEIRIVDAPDYHAGRYLVLARTNRNYFPVAGGYPRKGRNKELGESAGRRV